MADKIDLEKVKAAAEAMGRLNRAETEFLKTYLAAVGRAAIEAPAPAQAARRSSKRGPDKRGHYKCRKCMKVLPTKRGRGIHEASHETLDRAQLPLPEVP